ncbi:MAG: transglutaminase domain-containing protein [Bacteroidetes bacterium]|nr:transglutaminase domain-containing protein [Bacteroidota bacterium]
MARLTYFSITFLLTVLAGCTTQPDSLEQSSNLERSGRFTEARTILQSALAQATGEYRQQLQFELDRLRRIRLDYNLTRDALFESLHKSMPNLTPSEFEAWIEEGRFDGRIINDTLRFMYASRSNLFWRYPQLNSRKTRPPHWKKYGRRMWKTADAITRAAENGGTPLVLPKRFRVSMTVTAEPGAAPPGETIKAWLPIPRAFPHQRDFLLLSSSSPPVALSEEDAPIRSIHLEQEAREGEPTVFAIKYEYTAYGISHQMHPDSIQRYEKGDPLVGKYTAEGPHVVFTQRIKDVSARIVADEINPLVKARRIYDWITENFHYSYAIEYSTIRNISDNCITHRYGDCGQLALLFITLCRYNGVPTRWQSGWWTFPGSKTIHDWTEIFLEPYGWVPVDPNLGLEAIRYHGLLSWEERMRIRDFYFGGIDQYRIAANADHSQPLSPPKKSMRSDNVDFQRGELEYGETNIYFDQFSYGLSIEDLGTSP